MKKAYQYIALAVLVLGFAACTQEDDFTPQGNQTGAPLAIASAGVANLTTRAAITTTDGTDYLTGGSMGVFVKSENTDTRYKGDNLKWDYDDSWKPASTTVLYEADGAKQTIGAYYPYTEELTEGTCAIELPETFGSNYEDYDYLYANYVAVSANPMNIQMNHLLSKVTVSIASKGSEIDNADVVESISLHDVPRTAVWAVPTATLNDYGSGDKTVLYANDTNNDETVDNYVGYALPNEATTLHLRVTTKSGRLFTAKATVSGGMTAGVHYQIGLNVGKDKMEVSIVSVVPWGTGADLEDGVANEYIPSIDGTEYASLTDLQAAVKEKLSQEGVTSVTINGYLSDGMHAAIISAINEAKTEGAVINGSLLAGSVTYTVHSTFADAVAAWANTDGTTLTMLGNATCSEDIELTAKGLILDLNGCTLTSSVDDWKIYLGRDSAAELTLRDSNGGGYAEAKVVVFENSTLLLESGKVKQVAVAGKFTMTGGCVYAPDGVDSAIYGQSSTCKILVTGGEVYGSNRAAWMTCGSITITGTAKVSGGTDIIYLYEQDGGTATVTGGTFSHDPSAYVDTKHYTVTKNDDGTWSVTAKE